MNSKKITIICFVATVLIALFGGISVYAFTVNHPLGKADKGKEPRDEIKSTAVVENISDNSIELTLNKKDKDSDSKETSEKVTLTFNDKDTVEGIAKGDTVKVVYNRDNELHSIEKVDKDSDDSEQKITAKIEKIEGNQITVTEGTVDKDSDNTFTPSGESKTYTVEDSDDLDKVKVGDIVKIEIKDNKITDIDQLDKDNSKSNKPTDKSNQSNNKNQFNNTSSNYSTDV